MNATRREVLGTTAYLTAAALASGLGTAARAEEAAFDIDAAFAVFMRDTGQEPGDGGGAVTFTGSDPILRSHFRIGTSMALPAMAAAVGAAAIWKERTGEGQDVAIDLREAVYNVNPMMTPIMQHRLATGAVPPDDPVAKGFTFMPTINGSIYQAPVAFGNPFSFVPFRTKDGRFVNITGIYPHLNQRALNLLGVRAGARGDRGGDRDLERRGARGGDVRARRRRRDAPHERRVACPPGGRASRRHRPHRDPQDRRRRPRPWTADPVQPLSGVKVLALTHVIAGSTAARTLSEYGAEALQIMRDQSFEHEGLWTDVNIGMRSSALDLNRPDHAAALNALVPEPTSSSTASAAAGSSGWASASTRSSPGAPGVVYLTLRGYSWDGPWKNVRTFDMEAVSTTGFTIAEGSGGPPAFGEAFGDPYEEGPVPVFPPTLVLNDYIAGYLAAAGVIAALRRRATEGGSYHVHVNLARAAMWYASLGTFASTDFEVTEENRMIDPETFTFASPYGEVTGSHPMAKLSKTPGRWQEPLLTVRGSDLPVWKDAL